jgi:hypothetical protein
MVQGMRITSFLFLGLAMLAACTSTDHSKVGTVAVTPLSDLNLVRVALPDALQSALRGPYLLVAESSCPALDQEIKALTDVLGPDMDAPESERRGLIERGAELGSGAAVGALQRTAEGVIPFRGWIRELTGAERRSREVTAAITAGGVRRAFLRGVHAAKQCPVSPPSP